MYIRTSFLSCTFSASYPSNSSNSSGNFTTTDPPHPPTQVTRLTSVQIHPRFAHATSLTGDGFGAHRSTRRKVSSLSRNRSRSHGTKEGRDIEDTDEDDTRERSGRENFRIESRTGDASSVSLRRTFLSVGLAAMRSRVAGVAGDFEGSGDWEGLERESRMRWNLRFLVSRAYDMVREERGSGWSWLRCRFVDEQLI